MGLITPNDFPSLRELYTAQLRYLLSTENQIVDGLPKMIDHAEETQLKQAFQSHLQETRVHVQRIQRLLTDMTNDADDKKDNRKNPTENYEDFFHHCGTRLTFS